MTNPCRVVVAISGGGSNLQALIAAAASAPYTLVGVVSDNAEAFGLTRAARADIATTTVTPPAADDRTVFDAALAAAIDAYNPDLVVLAGFMRVIGAPLVNAYLGRMLNIHPALLPKYRGLHTHRRCLEAGDAEHGSTVHFVIPELDAGPTIAQAVLRVADDDTPETLSARVQALEHKLYPMVVRWFAEGRLHLNDDTVMLDDQPLTTPLRMDEAELR